MHPQGPVDIQHPGNTVGLLVQDGNEMIKIRPSIIRLKFVVRFVGRRIGAMRVGKVGILAEGIFEGCRRSLDKGVYLFRKKPRDEVLVHRFNIGIEPQQCIVDIDIGKVGTACRHVLAGNLIREGLPDKGGVVVDIAQPQARETLVVFMMACISQVDVEGVFNILQVNRAVSLIADSCIFK